MFVQKLLDIHKDMLSERLKKLEAYQKRTGNDVAIFVYIHMLYLVVRSSRTRACILVWNDDVGTDLGAATGVEDEWKDDDEDDGPGGDNDGSFSPELYSGSDNDDAVSVVLACVLAVGALYCVLNRVYCSKAHLWHT